MKNLMTGTTGRILLAAILLVLVYCGANWMQQGLRPSKVVLPDWAVSDLPMSMDGWEGEEAELDEDITRQLGAHSAVNRSYRQGEREPVAVHVAIFEKYDVGSFHNPANCYRSSGWTLIDDAPIRIETDEGSPVLIALSTWEKDGGRVTVAYWYQLGEHFATDRVQLGKARWDLRGSQQWPALVKVLMQTSTDNVDRSEEGIRELGSCVYRWLNDPDFRKTHATVTEEGGNGDSEPRTGS